MPRAKEILPRATLCTRGIGSSTLPQNRAHTLRVVLLLQGHKKNAQISSVYKFFAGCAITSFLNYTMHYLRKRILVI